MKLFIDTESKVIKIEETVNFGELIEKVKKLLPGEWKEYKIETNSVIQWYNPVVIQDWPLYKSYPTHPYPWWYQPPNYSTGATLTTSGGDPLTIDMSQQTQYCIEC